MLRLRFPAALFSIVVGLCLVGLWSARSQTASFHRLTITSGEGKSINPSLSGDGQRVAFESTEDLTGSGGRDGFRAIAATLYPQSAVFAELGATRAPAPGISQNGSKIAFAARENPLGTNADGNSEIYLSDGFTLRQITNTIPNEPSTSLSGGNFQPSLSDDGRFVAFSSNRNLVDRNEDRNLEIFVFDTTTNSFIQLTDTTDCVGASDAKISGDGSRVAYVHDGSLSRSADRDLVLVDRVSGATRVVATGISNLALTYGRAISDDGLRVIYSAEVSEHSSQVFLFDDRTTNSTRQITALGVREADVPLHPTISGDGTRCAFATRRTVEGLGGNSDNSIELYTYDIPTARFARITGAPSTADGFAGSNRITEVVSSLNDDGSRVAFNFPRSLSGAVAPGLENNSEIYIADLPSRPEFGSLTILNEASFGNEPSSTKAVAPDSRAVALGTALSLKTEQTHKQQDGSFPRVHGGTRVAVNNLAAQIFYVSPTQVNFLVPVETDPGIAEVVITNPEGFRARGSITVIPSAAGIFTTGGEGQGNAVALDADTGTAEPFDPTPGNLRLVIFTTGVRRATEVKASAGGRALTVDSVIPSRELPGLDEVHVSVPADLRGAGRTSLIVRADDRESNFAAVLFNGNPCGDIAINEFLADPAGDMTGDANGDGITNTAQDEFVELVNTTARDLDISGYQLLSRSSTAASDTIRHTFPPNTIFSAGSAIVVFGGGNPKPSNPAFADAQVFKATSGGLSLANSGGFITLRDPLQTILSYVAYGGSTGISGDANQSLTRAPEAGANAVCGPFNLHSIAEGSGGRVFSPGRRLDGSPFAPGAARLARLSILPASETIEAGRTTQFTAQALDQFNRPMDASITFQSNDPNVATIEEVTPTDSNGRAKATVAGRAEGTALITSTATDGEVTVSSIPARVTVTPPPPVATRVEVTAAYPLINRGQTRKFNATAFDRRNQPILGATITWTSSDTNLATIDATGLAKGVGMGSVTITAATPDSAGGMVSATTDLTVQVPILVNEILADPPDGGAGDSNQDGKRDSDDDEFVELVNNSSQPVDISGVIVMDSTSNRFTFPPNTTLAPGSATVVFGGGSSLGNDGFGGASIFTASSLSLGNSGDTVTIKLQVAGADVIVAKQSYALEGGDNQSLTRAPDLTDAVAKHSTANNSDGRLFSPGTRIDGVPFGSPPITRIELSPASAAIDADESQSFAARAFADSGGYEVEVPNVSFVWDSGATGIATVLPTTGRLTLANALVSGSSTIRARAGGQYGLALLTVNPNLSINDVSVTEGDRGTSIANFTISLSTPAPTAGVTFDIATEDGSARIADGDYVGRSLERQTIPAGSQAYAFHVTVNGDTQIEPNETFAVNITNVSGAKVADGKGVGTILNDDIPALTINDATESEGDTGTKVLTFEVSLSRPAPLGGVTFNIATDDNTATVADDDYVARLPSRQTIAAGQQAYSFQVIVKGDSVVESHESFYVDISDVSGAVVLDGRGQGTIINDDVPNIVVSQLYGGGGNAGALFANDFIELFNRGTTTVNLSGWSVQYSSASGTGAWAVTPLCAAGPCMLAPGHYFLIKEAPGSAGGPSLPTPDAIGTIAMATASGKVALVSHASAIKGACPMTDAGIVDLVGYGASATTSNTCFEGNAPAPSPGNATAVLRRSGGCTDTNQNAADLLLFAPWPRNLGTPSNNCDPGTIPNLSINDVIVTEGDAGLTTATFTVTLSTPASGADVTFDISTADKTATSGNNDYTAKSLTNQLIPAGHRTYTFSVSVKGDTGIEPDETFFINVTNVRGANVTDGQGEGTIRNDDLPTLTIDDAIQNEGDSGTTALTFVVRLSAPAPAAVTFNLLSVDGTAQDGNPSTEDSDYRFHSGEHAIPAGHQNYAFEVILNGDLRIEADEVFSILVTNVAGAIVVDEEATGTIRNDDSPVLSIDDVSIDEGNSGTTIVSFTIRSSLPAPPGGISFDIQTVDGTATDDDYAGEALTGQGIIAGQQFYTYQLAVKGDLLVEPNESFFVELSNVLAATVSDARGEATIRNDDAADLVVSQVYGGGNNSGAQYRNDFIEIFNRGLTTVDFAVTPYSVQYSSTATWAKTNIVAGTIGPGGYFLIQGSGGTTNGAALPAPDATGSLNLTAGSPAKIALVRGTTLLPASSCPGDDGGQPFNALSESIVDFVGYGGTATTASHCYEGAGPAPALANTAAGYRRAGGCTDSQDNSANFFTSAPLPRNSESPANNCIPELPPDLSIDDVTMSEGNSGTTTARFTVSLSAPSPSIDVTFDIGTQNDTATTANGDYVARNLTTQVIPAGQRTYVFSTTINGDTIPESDESFFVKVTNVSGANVIDGQGLGTIQNDDLPSLSIYDVSSSEGDSGTKSFSFTVTLSSPAPQGGVTFDIATQDGKAAIENNDYVERSLTGQKIPAESQTFTFEVSVRGDLDIEADETFFVHITNVSGATVADAQGTAVIVNDDSPVLAVDDVSSEESNNGTTILTFTVSSSLPAPAGGITFDIATADGTAQDGNPSTEDFDYVSRSLSAQTITAGSQAYLFTVTVNGDTIVEPDETFIVRITNVSGATVADGEGLGTIRNDDAAPQPAVVISQVYGAGGNSGASLRNDFIEIFNRGTTAVDLTGWSVQYAGATGSSWQVTHLSGVLQAGQYYLVRLGSGGTNGALLPTPDATGTIAMAAGAGKVALVHGTTALTGACPSRSTIVDLVGYGATASCFEGSAAAQGPGGNTTAVIRVGNGCTDTNNNAGDFSLATPNPRNNGSTGNLCGGS